MNYFLNNLKLVLLNFQRNKLRTFLTSLGILIGVCSVVLLISFGLGLKKYIQNQFTNLGTNLIIVRPGKTFGEGGFQQGAGIFGGIKFDEKDVKALQRLSSYQYLAPTLIKTVSIEAKGKTELADLYATNEEIFPLRNFEKALGEFFTQNDLTKTNKVAVLGPKIAEKLFGKKEFALNQTIKVENLNFRVIGVFKAKGGGGFGGPDFDSFVIVPYTSVTSLNPQNQFFTILIKAPNQESIAKIKKEVTSILLKRYKEDDFSVSEQTEIIKTIFSILSVLNLILIAIAAISLIVGGVGIMNIMYVSVIERITEVGLRRCLGATKNDILWQFLTEAVILSLAGGILGLTVAFLLVFLIQNFFPAYINFESVVASLVISSLIGIFFGVKPAKKAADLNPIDALRYE